MARLQCRSCGFDGEIEWDGRLVCPSCGSNNARVAALTEEMPDEFFAAIAKSLGVDLDDPDGFASGNTEIEVVTHGEIPEKLQWNSGDAEKAPAMIFRCRACGYEFRTAKEIASWPTGCPKCGHPRVRLADCVEDVAIDLQERTMQALPEIVIREDYEDE